MLYYKNNLTVLPEKEINSLKETESAWIELTTRSQKYLIGVVYRPPSNASFYDNFTKILSQLWLARNHVIILGDFNSDLLCSNDTNGRKFKRILQSFDFHNVIQEATRVTETSETLIDLILISNQIKQKGMAKRSGVFEPAFSDHKLIYTVLKICQPRSHHECKVIQDKRNFDEEKFKEKLTEAP